MAAISSTVSFKPLNGAQDQCAVCLHSISKKNAWGHTAGKAIHAFHLRCLQDSLMVKQNCSLCREAVGNFNEIMTGDSEFTGQVDAAIHSGDIKLLKNLLTSKKVSKAYVALTVLKASERRQDGVVRSLVSEERQFPLEHIKYMLQGAMRQGRGDILKLLIEELSVSEEFIGGLLAETLTAREMNQFELLASSGNISNNLKAGFLLGRAMPLGHEAAIKLMFPNFKQLPITVRDQLLHRAIELDQLRLFISLLPQGVEISEEARGAFIKALLVRGNLQGALFFLQEGAPISELDRQEAIGIAVQGGLVDVLPVLIPSSGGIINDTFRQQAMVFVAKSPNLALLKVLLDRGLKFSKDSIKQLLQFIVENKAADKLQLLLKNNVQISGSARGEAAVLAANEDALDVLALLIPEGAEMSSKKWSELLIVLISKGHRGLLASILGRNPIVPMSRFDWGSVIEEAVSVGDPQMLGYLLSINRQISVESLDSALERLMTPEQQARHRQDVEMQRSRDAREEQELRALTNRTPEQRERLNQLEGLVRLRSSRPQEDQSLQLKHSDEIRAMLQVKKKEIGRQEEEDRKSSQTQSSTTTTSTTTATSTSMNAEDEDDDVSDVETASEEEYIQRD